MNYILDRWRREGFQVFLHVDDNIGLIKQKDEARRANEIVREDLKRYGLLVSDEKFD